MADDTPVIESQCKERRGYHEQLHVSQDKAHDRTHETIDLEFKKARLSIVKLFDEKADKDDLDAKADKADTAVALTAVKDIKKLFFILMLPVKNVSHPIIHLLFEYCFLCCPLLFVWISSINQCQNLPD